VRNTTRAASIHVIYATTGNLPPQEVEDVTSPLDVLINAFADAGWEEVPANGCTHFVLCDDHGKRDIILSVERQVMPMPNNR
jgi:hypothetical protein